MDENVALELSYRQLPTDHACLFRLLGLHPGPDFTPAAAAALAGIEREAAEPILGQLAKAHLVMAAKPVLDEPFERYLGTGDASFRFRMPDSLRLFARAACHRVDSQAALEAAEARLVRHYTSLALFLTSCVDPRKRPAAEQARAPLPSFYQAYAVYAAEQRNLLAALGLATRRGWDEQAQLLAQHTSLRPIP